LLKTNNSIKPSLIQDSMMDKYWVLLTLRQVSTKFFKEMVETNHGQSILMNHQVLSSMHIEFQMSLKSSQVQVSPRVAPKLRFLEPGSIISHNTELFLIASLEIPLSVLISIHQLDLYVILQQLQDKMPILTLRYHSMVSTGHIPTSLLHTSRNQQ
jgi:hypothetical protein